MKLLDSLDHRTHVIEKNFERALDIIQKQIDTLINDQNRFYAQTLQDNTDLRTELKSQPPRLADNVCALETQLKEVSIDKAELLKELRVLKKDFFISEKKIEDLYSRLKEAQHARQS